MSKPSELLDNILDDVITLRRVGVARLDGELCDRVEQELRDAARLMAQATAAVHQLDREVRSLQERAGLDRSG